MCGSMVDIQSTAAEIRRGKEKKKERKKIDITGQKYNGLPYYIGATITSKLICAFKNIVIRKNNTAKNIMQCQSSLRKITVQNQQSVLSGHHS